LIERNDRLGLRRRKPKRQAEPDEAGRGKAEEAASGARTETGQAGECHGSLLGKASRRSIRNRLDEAENNLEQESGKKRTRAETGENDRLVPRRRNDSSRNSLLDTGAGLV